MLIPGKHWINSFISRNRGCPGTVLEFRLNVYRTHGSRLSVYILRFQHYLTFGIRLHSGTFPSPGPPLQVQVMCLWIAVMLTFLKCSDTFIFLPLHSCSTREYVARRQALKQIFCIEPLTSDWVIPNMRKKLVQYEEMVQLYLCVRTCFAWHVVSNDWLVIQSIIRLFEYRK